MLPLSGLRDVEGVHGSFVVSDDGALLGKDLPAVFHDDLLLEAGPRLVRLCEALEHGGEAVENLALRFTDHKLHVRRTRGGFVCVIAEAGVNGPALKMALSLVVRRLGATETGSGHSVPAPTPTSSRSVESRQSNPPPPSVKRPARYYRGYRVED